MNSAQQLPSEAEIKALEKRAQADQEKWEADCASGLQPVKGNTYPVRSQLKAIGATWDRDENAWMIAADKLAQAEAIVAENKPAFRRTRKPTVGHSDVIDGYLSR